MRSLFILILYLTLYAEKGRIEIGSKVGFSYPYYPLEFRNYYSNGKSIGIEASYFLSEKVPISINFLYNDFRLSEEKFIKNSGLDDKITSIKGGRTLIWLISGNIRFISPSFFHYIKIYIGIGCGYLKRYVQDIIVGIKIPIGDTIENLLESDENKLRFHKKDNLCFLISGGTEIKISKRIHLFVELNYIIGKVPFWNKKEIHLLPFYLGIKVRF